MVVVVRMVRMVELKEETSRYFDGVVGNDEREKNYNDGGGGWWW